MIIEQDKYDGSLIATRFAHRFFKEKTLPVGNIVVFRSPVLIDGETDTPQQVDMAVNFCFELPLANVWGAVAFQRLLSSVMGDIISSMCKVNVEIENEHIYVLQEFESNGITLPKGKVNLCEVRSNPVAGYVGTVLSTGEKASPFLFPLSMLEDKWHTFASAVVQSFYGLATSIFIASSSAKS